MMRTPNHFSRWPRPEGLKIFRRYGLRAEKLAREAAYRVHDMEGIRAKAARYGTVPGIEKTLGRSPYVFQNKGSRNDEVVLQTADGRVVKRNPKALKKNWQSVKSEVKEKTRVQKN
eukprot:sb/3476636/